MSRKKSTTTEGATDAASPAVTVDVAAVAQCLASLFAIIGKWKDAAAFAHEVAGSIARHHANGSRRFDLASRVWDEVSASPFLDRFDKKGRVRRRIEAIIRAAILFGSLVPLK